MKVKYVPLVAMLLFAFSIAVSAQPSPATISGTINDGNGNPLAGVVVELQGGQSRIVTTKADGQYSFPTTPTNNFYVVTPQLANYTFSPSYRAFSLNGTMSGQDFTGTLGQLTTSPLDTAEFFVRQQYVDLLRREPDEGGLNFWSSALKACTTLECRIAKRRDIMCAFIASGEYQARFTGPATTICQ